MDPGIAIGIAGIIIGIVVAIVVTRYFTESPRLDIRLDEIAVIAPTQMGLDVSMKVGPRLVSNLYILDLTIRNRGPRDVEGGVPATSEDLALRPRIEFPVGLRAVADPWTDSERSASADVRVARQRRDADDRQLLHVHLRLLKADSEIRTRIICTSDANRADLHLEASEFDFFPGSMAGVNFVGSGLLNPPPRYLSS